MYEPDVLIHFIRLGLHGFFMIVTICYMLSSICISLVLDACIVLSGKNSTSGWTSPLNASSSVMEFWR